MQSFSTTKSFALSKKEYELLVVLQATKAKFFAKRYKEDHSDGAKLDKWIKDWLGLLHSSNLISFKDVPDEATVKAAVAALDHLPLLKQHNIAFEAMLFEPFFAIGKKAYEGLGKKLQAHSDISEEARSALLDQLSECSVDSSLLEGIGDEFEAAIKSLNPSRLFERIAIGVVAAALLGITAGFAAPAIGAIVGGMMGLSGAAATSAGLAFLGGGALATGGFGMAGGTIALIGGGALFGGAAGFAGIALTASSKLMIRELAKLVVIIDLFVPLLETEEQSVIVDEIQSGSRDFRNQLRKLINELKKENDDSQKSRLKEAEASLAALDKFREWLADR